MLRFSFKILFCFFSVVLFAQKETPKDTLKKTERYGFRIGADLSKLSRSLYDKNYKGFEIVGDYRLAKKLYLAAELGSENKTTIDNRLDFTTKGNYLRIGPEWNFYQNWLDMENMITLGFRYGFSSFSQELNSYKIYDTSTYFPQTTTVISGTKFNGLSAHWAEVVSGIKAELINNLYLGFTLRLNYLTTDKKPENFNNLYIPGYHRTYDGKFGVGWNYTVSYFIPLYKKKK